MPKPIFHLVSLALLARLMCEPISLSADQPDGDADPPRKRLEVVENSVGMRFVRIPAGEFLMGSPEDEPHRFECEKQHRVRLTQDYLLGIEEVTVAQYRRVTSSVPTIEHDTNAAVRQVSWHEAVEFCRKLSELEAEKQAGRSYRLPTEAEWEYACRAGTKTAYSWGDDPAQADDYAWWLKTTMEVHTFMRVGSRKPNPWGLHDMHGGVWEWCSDWFEDFTAEEQVDPRGPVSGEEKVLKGGAMNCAESYLRSATRVPYEPVFSQGYLGQTIGFRVVLIEPPADSKPAK